MQLHVLIQREGRQGVTPLIAEAVLNTLTPPHTPSYLQRKQATHNRYIFEPPLTKIAGSAPELIRMYNYNNIP